MKPASAATAAPVSTVGGGGGGVGTGVGTGAGAGAGFGVGAGSGAVSAAASGSNAHRSGRALIPVQRLDLEPIYSQLKNAIGSHWAEYKDATTQFLLGDSQPPFLLADGVLRPCADACRLQDF